MSLQQVDSFVFKLSTAKDMNTETRRKIRDLTLSESEWTRVRLFNNLLQASYFFSLVLYPFSHPPSSMLMKLSMLSLLRLAPLCTTRSLPSKNYTLNGKRHQQSFATTLSRMHLKLQWRSLMNTMREHLHRMRTLYAWVCNIII